MPLSPQEIQNLNAKWTQGIGPGFWPTQGAGLSLNLTEGISFVNGTIIVYVGGALTMTNNTTNYIYINSSGVPTTKTTTFISTDIPIAIVVTSGGSITTISDARNWFVFYNTPYVIAFWEGDPTLITSVAASQILQTHQLPGSSFLANVTLPVGLVGSCGGCKTNPGSAVTITIEQNGGSIGTINISTGGVMTFTFSSVVALNPLDRLDFIFQASSSTIAGIWWTIVGMRS